jgi:S-adenosylhomocysteine hydrolase
MRSVTSSPLLSTHAASTNPSLPVLDAVAAEMGSLPDRVRIIVGLQHLLGSTVTLVDRLVGEGSENRNVFLLGKPYSTSPRVLRFVESSRPWWVHPDSALQAVDVDNDSEMDRRIQELLARVERCIRERRFGAGDRVLLIDDGGRAIRQLHGPRFRHLLPHFVSVEQTRCGVSTLEDLELEVPVVDVARSKAKLVHESPLIAESVIHEIRQAVWAMGRRGIRVPNEVAVLGYGSIGAAVAQALTARGHRVRVFDADRERLRAARREGLETITSRQALLAQGGLIVGCTGRPSVGPEDYDVVAHNAVLVSASSSDLEFQAWNLRPEATCLGHLGHRPELRDHPCFSLYRVHRRNHGFYLVNGGFPVNFTGAPDPIAPELIQLTRTLLYVGAVQASRSDRPGWIPLDLRAQELTLDRYCGLSIAA